MKKSELKKALKKAQKLEALLHEAKNMARELEKEFKAAARYEDDAEKEKAYTTIACNFSCSSYSAFEARNYSYMATQSVKNPTNLSKLIAK